MFWWEQTAVSQQSQGVFFFLFSASFTLKLVILQFDCENAASQQLEQTRAKNVHIMKHDLCKCTHSVECVWGSRLWPCDGGCSQEEAVPAGMSVTIVWRSQDCALTREKQWCSCFVGSKFYQNKTEWACYSSVFDRLWSLLFVALSWVKQAI